MPKIAAIQMESGQTIGANLVCAKLLLKQAADRGTTLAVLPENFAFMGTDDGVLYIKENIGAGRIQDFISQQAQQLGIWIIAGSMPIACKQSDNKVKSACLVWNDQGQLVARYDKIHLFDVCLPGPGEMYQESTYYNPGNSTTVIDTPIGKIGLSICYDLRFPELYRELRKKGAEIIAVPSAFTATTGKMHWEPLLRARAIENQCYVIGANQSGKHDNHRRTYGHSMIISPWGKIFEEKKTGAGVIVSDIDLSRVHILREEFPVWSHRQDNNA